MLLLDQVVERSSSPISECPPDDEVGTLRSNDSDDRLSNPEKSNNDGSPVSIFKSRMRQKDSGLPSQRNVGQYVPVNYLIFDEPCCFFSIAGCPGSVGVFLNSSETNIDTVTDPIETSVNSEETSDFGDWYFHNVVDPVEVVLLTEVCMIQSASTTALRGAALQQST
jgi:hypothetical protein